MSPITTGSVGLGVLLLLLAAGMPIGFVMVLVGFTGFALLTSTGAAWHIVGTIPYELISNYNYSVLPLFLFMASICLNSGLGKSLYNLMYTWVGRLPGGLAIATIFACGVFSAISSSSIACTLTVGLIAIPEMRRYKYDSGLIAGSVAAGGTLDILIPPSGMFIIYGILTEQSIGKLFIAGMIPGIILLLMFIVVVYFHVRLNPTLAPSGSSTTFQEKMAALGECAEILALCILILGGLIIGWFTPTEAGAIGAFGAIAFSLIRRRLSWQGFKDSVIDTIRNTGMIFMIMTGALIFNAFLAVTTIPMELAGWVSGLALPRVFILIIILLMYIILGTFLDELAMILLTLPIFFPVVTRLGFDPIWFGVVIVLVVQMGMISPPVGITMFVVKGIAPDIPIETIFKGVVPFCIAVVVLMILLIAFPQIALFLPGLTR